MFLCLFTTFHDKFYIVIATDVQQTICEISLINGLCDTLCTFSQVHVLPVIV